MRHGLILFFGLLCASSSVIFIKKSGLDPVLLAAGRLWLGAVAVTPWFLKALVTHREFFRRHGRRTLWPGLLLGVHFVTWIIGARLTPAVNSSLLVNMVPLVTPFFLHSLANERPLGRELVATLVAFTGVVWLCAWDYDLSREYFLGDVVCFGSMILFAVYLVLGRANRDFPDVWLYMWPVYCAGGAVCLLLTLPWTDFAQQPYTTNEFLLLFGLGIVPTVLGHGSVTYALKHLRGQVVGVANLGQVLFAGVFAYVFLGEVPHAAFFPASVLIALGVALVLGRKT